MLYSDGFLCVHFALIVCCANGVFCNELFFATFFRNEKSSLQFYYNRRIIKAVNFSKWFSI